MTRLTIFLVGGLLAAIGAVAAPAHATRPSPLSPLSGLSPAQPSASLAWCGTDESTADRPDLVGGPQIRIVYALPSDGGDRFADLAPKIASDMAAIDAWWRGQDPTRTPRFDLAAFPGCPPGLDQLDIGFVRLSGPGSEYYSLSTRMSNLALDLYNAGVTSGPQESYKKTIVYYDAPVERANACGGAYIEPDSGGEDGIVGVWVQGPDGCGTVGNADYQLRAIVYDLILQLGGVSAQSPHACAQNAFTVCDNGQDVMWGGTPEFPSLFDYILDVGHDDYYGHSGPWLDIQDSPWLRHLNTPQFPLTVTLSGAQAGDSVTSDIPGIVCGTQCSTTLDSGTAVELSPASESGKQVFVRWGGDCTGDETCSLTMDAAHNVQAVFGPSTYRVSVRVVGKGRVSTSGFGCAKTCSKALESGLSFRFKAAPAKKWRFSAWGGACHGRGVCRVAATAPRSVVATFKRVKPRKK